MLLTISELGWSNWLGFPLVFSPSTATRKILVQVLDRAHADATFCTVFSFACAASVEWAVSARLGHADGYERHSQCAIRAGLHSIPVWLHGKVSYTEVASDGRGMRTLGPFVSAYRAAPTSPFSATRQQQPLKHSRCAKERDSIPSIMWLITMFPTTFYFHRIRYRIGLRGQSSQMPGPETSCPNAWPR
ncbi:hypothetical protein BST61_g5645 [Cercospora zeina]